MNKITPILLVLAIAAAVFFAYKLKSSSGGTRPSIASAGAGDTNLQSELNQVRQEFMQRKNVESHQAAPANQVAMAQEIQDLKQSNQELEKIITNVAAAQAAPVSQPAASPTPVPQPPTPAPAPAPEPTGPLNAQRLGLQVVDMNEFRQMNRRQGTMPAEGAAIIDINPDGAGAISGLQLGDIIVQLNGQVVTDPASLDAACTGLIPGSAAPITINRTEGLMNLNLIVPTN